MLNKNRLCLNIIFRNFLNLEISVITYIGTTIKKIYYIIHSIDIYIHMLLLLLIAVLSTGVIASHTCAILDNGSVSCWGYNKYGQLGNGDVDGANRDVPTLTSSLGEGRTAVAISMGTYHTCAILDNGSVSCWGLNIDGQLGNGDNARSYVPTLTSSLGGGRTAVAISMGTHHTCAILDDGSVSCWGKNDGGQLGNEDVTEVRLTPTLTSSLGECRTAVAISAGYYYTCAILDNGSVSCWGKSECVILDDGTDDCEAEVSDEEKSRPTPISSLGEGRKAAAIYTSGRHTCVILDNGSVSCWGENYYGQLGDDTYIHRNKPAPISTLGESRTANVMQWNSADWDIAADGDSGGCGGGCGGGYRGYTRADGTHFNGQPSKYAFTIEDSFYGDEPYRSFNISTCFGGGPECARRLAVAREPHQWVGGVLKAPLKTGDMQFVGPFNGKLRGVKVQELAVNGKLTNSAAAGEFVLAAISDNPIPGLRAGKVLCSDANYIPLLKSSRPDIVLKSCPVAGGLCSSERLTALYKMYAIKNGFESA